MSEIAKRKKSSGGNRPSDRQAQGFPCGSISVRRADRLIAVEFKSAATSLWISREFGKE